MNALALTYRDAGQLSTIANRVFAGVDYTYASARTREESRPHPSAWHNEVASRLRYLLDLEEGWDGAASPGIRVEIAAFALSVLSSVMRAQSPAPFIAPVTGGGLQIEWHQGGLDIELYIAQPSRAELYIEYMDGRQAVEKDLAGDFSELASAVAEIS